MKDKNNHEPCDYITSVNGTICPVMKYRLIYKPFDYNVLYAERDSLDSIVNDYGKLLKQKEFSVEKYENSEWVKVEL